MTTTTACPAGCRNSTRPSAVAGAGVQLAGLYQMRKLPRLVSSRCVAVRGRWIAAAKPAVRMAGAGAAAVDWAGAVGRAGWVAAAGRAGCVVPLGAAAAGAEVGGAPAPGVTVGAGAAAARGGGATGTADGAGPGAVGVAVDWGGSEAGGVTSDRTDGNVPEGGAGGAVAAAVGGGAVVGPVARPVPGAAFGAPGTAAGGCADGAGAWAGVSAKVHVPSGSRMTSRPLLVRARCGDWDGDWALATEAVSASNATKLVFASTADGPTVLNGLDPG